MKKTIFILALALTLPLIAQARRTAKPLPVAKAFKKVEKDNKNLIGLCGAQCANQITAMKASFGEKVQGVVESFKGLSFGLQGTLAVAGALNALPGVHIQAHKYNAKKADELTAGMLVAAQKSTGWSNSVKKTFEKFRENVVTDGVITAVQTSFPGQNVANKIQEITKGCRY